MSGSMRRDDVNGARCRSDGVWIALARDFIGRQLETKRASIFDVVSVILMQEDSKVLYECFPIDWTLYCGFVENREWDKIRPSGPGNYLPALELAERLLGKNPCGSCALSLMFFSDGKPSDRGPFVEKMGAIASKFGRRLTVCCIGMADDTEDFSTLRAMVAEADSFGALASFNKPSLSTDSLSNIITSLVTSLASSKTEMTDLKTGKSRSVRADVLRERKGVPDDLELTDEWRAFRGNSNSNYVFRIWSWSYEKDDFVQLIDPRCIECSRLVCNGIHLAPSPLVGLLCPKCKACCVCWRCAVNDSHLQDKRPGECKRFLRDRRSGKLIKQPVTSFSMAIKKLVFGEGAERIVYKVRFMNEKGRFIGPKMVAKESRFVIETNTQRSYEGRMEYHREFMRCQLIASELADKFNNALDLCAAHFGQAAHKGLSRNPRIRFLKPTVVEVHMEDGTEWNVLVEEQLEGDYKKFNSNNGHVRDKDLLSLKNLNINEEPDPGLDAIAEGSEDEEDSDDEIFDEKESGPMAGHYKFRDEDFPQAFSHFSYEKSKKFLMVVDLQGIFRVNKDGTKEYILTDPAIHQRKRRRSNRSRNWSFGRTDRGEKGMKAFFDTHECNDACRFVGLTEYKHR
jgi:hypothetical protein